MHLVAITKVYPLVDGAGQLIVKENAIGVIIRFQIGDGTTHEQMFWCDQGPKQKLLDHILWCVGVDNTKGQVEIEAPLNKRLWIAIKALVKTCNGDVEKDIEGNTVRSFWMFNCWPYENEETKPKVIGDPGPDADLDALVEPFVQFKEEAKIDPPAPATPGAGDEPTFL